MVLRWRLPTKTASWFVPPLAVMAPRAKTLRLMYVRLTIFLCVCGMKVLGMLSKAFPRLRSVAKYTCRRQASRRSTSRLRQWGIARSPILVMPPLDPFDRKIPLLRVSVSCQLSCMRLRAISPSKLQGSGSCCSGSVVAAFT